MTTISRSSAIAAAARMRWRVSADFWDDWEKLARMFELLDTWSPFIGAGHWPDVDMLPIGHLSLDDRPHGPDRLSRFTWEERKTLTSLAFLKNSEVLAVNQDSADSERSSTCNLLNPTDGVGGIKFSPVDCADDAIADHSIASYAIEHAVAAELTLILFCVPGAKAICCSERQAWG
jgi:hypothetical protein